MKQLWKTWAAKYDALQRRERLLVLAMVPLTILFIGNATLIDPLAARQKILQAQMDGDRVQIEKMQQQMLNLTQHGQRDPDQGNKARMADFQHKLQGVDGALDTLRQGFVTPEKMPQLLDGLLKKNNQLKLVALKTLPVSALPLPPKTGAAITKPSPGNDLAVFRHGVELTVEGHYLDVLNYLESLEQMPWSMLWSRAVLDTGPAGAVSLTLTVYTLNLDKTWLSL